LNRRERERGQEWLKRYSTCLGEQSGVRRERKERTPITVEQPDEDPNEIQKYQKLGVD
jgi:hypothetical protein